jgi:hypothetical protein
VLNFSFDGLSEAVEKFESMQEKIKALEHTGLVEETRNWEVRDVHRHRPGAHRMRGGGSWVKFRPHSQYEMRRARRAQRRPFRKGRYLYRVSQRPILRPFLISRLEERISELLANTLKW